MSGWFEDYGCGCVSDVVTQLRDLPGYCPKHGHDRRRTWPVAKVKRKMTVYGTCLMIYNDKRLKPNMHSQYRVVVMARSKAAARRAIVAAGHHITSRLELTPTANEQELAIATVENKLYAKGLYDWQGEFVAIS